MTYVILVSELSLIFNKVALTPRQSRSQVDMTKDQVLGEGRGSLEEGGRQKQERGRKQDDRWLAWGEPCGWIGGAG